MRVLFMDSEKGWTGREDEIIEEGYIPRNSTKRKMKKGKRNFKMKTNYNFIKLSFNRTLKRIMDQNKKF